MQSDYPTIAFKLENASFEPSLEYSQIYFAPQNLKASRRKHIRSCLP